MKSLVSFSIKIKNIFRDTNIFEGCAHIRGLDGHHLRHIPLLIQ